MLHQRGETTGVAPFLLPWVANSNSTRESFLQSGAHCFQVFKIPELFQGWTSTRAALSEPPRLCEGHAADVSDDWWVDQPIALVSFKIFWTDRKFPFQRIVDKQLKLSNCVLS